MVFEITRETTLRVTSIIGVSLFELPSNGGRTCPLVHGSGHYGLVPRDGTAHEPPRAQHTIQVITADRQRSRWTCP